MTVVAQIEQRLMDKRHLACLRRFIDRDMLAGLEQIPEYHALRSATYEIPAGHMFVIYERCIHQSPIYFSIAKLT